MSERVLLSSDVVVSHYDLAIKTNLEGSFRFEADITLSCELKTSWMQSITLHSNELSLHTAVYTSGDKSFAATSFEYDIEMMTCKISFFKKGTSILEGLPMGEGFLHIVYTGLHNDQMNGFYRCKSEYIHGYYFSSSRICLSSYPYLVTRPSFM